MYIPKRMLQSAWIYLPIEASCYMIFFYFVTRYATRHITQIPLVKRISGVSCMDLEYMKTNLDI